MILTIILVFLVIVIGSGTYLLDQMDGWALLTFSNWIIITTIFIGLFIIVDLIFLFHPSFKQLIPVEEGGKPEFIDGKRVYEYRYPEGEKEGVFSKTYIPLDDKTLIRIKTLLGSLSKSEEEKH